MSYLAILFVLDVLEEEAEGKFVVEILAVEMEMIDLAGATLGV